MSDNDGLERAASEYIQRLPFAGTLGEYDNAVRKLVALLAAQRAAVLETVAVGLREDVLYCIEDEAYDNKVGKDGDGTSRNQGVNAAIRYVLMQAKEQR